ncbi:hypothetical protein OCU04_003586 [Sclerotinia nivalis]|uniref:Uncharacterized protein n=1 Tax=Sclerotinia nivalis TaxID=352851 RepID=A0A9X0AVQ1_9HELO|nr:hypothetical protein OCU04_003586 [Sclerotinia nivalis]
MLLSISVLLLQRLHTIEENWQLQSVIFLGSVALVVLFAWFFRDIIKFVIETIGSEKLHVAIALIPVALSLLVALWENIIICVRAGWDNAVIWLEFLIAGAQAKFWDTLAEFTRRIGYIPDTRPGL